MMAHSVRTFALELTPPVESVRPEVMISVAAAADSAEVLAIKAVARKYALKPDSVATKVLTFPSNMSSVKIDITSGIPKKVTTSKLKFKPAQTVETRTVKVSFDSMKGRVKRIVFKPLEDIKTQKSEYLDNAPLSREMIDNRKIPFPVMSEFMSELAKKHKTSYTNIRFIGAFDPIPLHLAEKFTIDPVSGVLKFYMRKEPRGDRHFARVVYGRKRDTGEIVSAVFPVT